MNKPLAALFAIFIAAGCAKLQPQPPPPGMVLIPGGKFQMGSNEGPEDELPVHEVELSPFWMDETEVTNRQFAEFVKATGYVTVAEKAPRPEDFPDVPKDKLVPGGLVFTSENGWQYIPKASWRHPTGPSSSIDKIMDHPVVLVCWDDAQAYARWAGKELPTEAQYEYAARGSKPGQTYSWGNSEPTSKDANIWQGDFPKKNDNTDGHPGTAPVKSFPANGFGLYDIAGNVWEWCNDWYRPDAYASHSKKDPTGPIDSFDPAEEGTPKRVLRGGSFLCADCYCRGYRAAARMKTSPDTGLNHTGFRCVKTPAPGHS